MNSAAGGLGPMLERFTSLSAAALTALLFVYSAAVFFSFGTQSSQLSFIPSVALGFALLAGIFWLTTRTFALGGSAPLAAGYLPWIVIGTGLSLRVAFGLAVHPVPASDLASYDFTARHLLTAGEYICREAGFTLHAYRPPGVAFLLAATMALAGQQPWAALLMNCVLFLFSSLLLWGSVKGMPRLGVMFVLGMLAIWPSEVMAASLPQSETPSVLVSAALIYVLARTGNPWKKTIALGLITGLSCLMRNSNLIMIPVWLFVIAQMPVRIGQRCAMALLLAACAFAPIVPWTVRNHHVLGKTVLVATNGGDNLYTSNNSQTGGGWDETAAAQLRTYLPDELAMDKAGMQLAKQWIFSHPGAFLRLSFQKIRILFGSDNWGPYWSLERGRGYTGPWYTFSLMLANMWWLALWGCVLLTIAKHPSALRLDLTLAAVAAFTLLPALLFFVFQSQARYHAFMIPGLIWLASRPSMFILRREG